MVTFVPGRELSRRFYWEAARPIVDAHYPNLPHAAGRLGVGSDVLGLDTAMSTDHGWGPMVHLFLREEEAALSGDIRELLRHKLPPTFLGYSVHFEDAPNDPGTAVMTPVTAGPVNHRVTVTTVRAFLWEQLRWDVDEPLAAADWLTFSSQWLLQVTAGAIHHDGVGQLTAVRERLAWYPPDVWLYLLAAGWTRLGQEEHLMGRAGLVGDELGSALIGSRLVRDVMSLCFLMERRYAPYPKWFGAAFKGLAGAAELGPLLWRAQTAATWQERETALCQAYAALARQHNRLGLTAALPEEASSFFNRPFQVINAGRFAEALVAQITDPEVKRLAGGRLIGSIDQFSDSTDLRSDPAWRPVLRPLFPS